MMKNSLCLPVLPFHLLIAPLCEGTSCLSWMQALKKMLKGVGKTLLESLFRVVWPVAMWLASDDGLLPDGTG